MTSSISYCNQRTVEKNTCRYKYRFFYHNRQISTVASCRLAYRWNVVGSADRLACEAENNKTDSCDTIWRTLQEKYERSRSWRQLHAYITSGFGLRNSKRLIFASRNAEIRRALVMRTGLWQVLVTRTGLWQVLVTRTGLCQVLVTRTGLWQVLVTRTGLWQVLVMRTGLWQVLVMRTGLWQVLVMGPLFVTSTGYGKKTVAILCYGNRTVTSVQDAACKVLQVSATWLTDVKCCTNYSCWSGCSIVPCSSNNNNNNNNNNNSNMSCHLLPAPLLLVHSWNRNNTQSCGVTEPNLT